MELMIAPKKLAELIARKREHAEVDDLAVLEIVNQVTGSTRPILMSLDDVRWLCDTGDQADDSSDEDDESDGESEVDPDADPATKKPKTARGGRKKKGEDPAPEPDPED